MRPRNAAVDHFDADQPARNALILLGFQRVPADEVALIQLHEEADARLQRRDVLRQLLPVQRQLCLEAERIPCP
ncbi:hypothetical protein D3C71_1748920 [compost metagenome]